MFGREDERKGKKPAEKKAWRAAGIRRLTAAATAERTAATATAPMPPWTGCPAGQRRFAAAQCGGPRSARRRVQTVQNTKKLFLFCIGSDSRWQCRRPVLILLIYVVFRATRYECLSVSNISELSSRRFSELLLFFFIFLFFFYFFFIFFFITINSLAPGHRVHRPEVFPWDRQVAERVI